MIYFNGCIWALHTRGFSKYNDKMKTWISISVKDGLPDADIKGLLQDASYLWVNTDRGVFRYNSDNEVWENFSINTPIESQRINDFSISGNISFFATDSGIYSYKEDVRKWTLYTRNDGLFSNKQQMIIAASGYSLTINNDILNIYRADEDLWTYKRINVGTGQNGATSWKAYSDERGIGASAPQGESVNILGRAYLKMKHKFDLPAPVANNFSDYISSPTDPKFNHFQYWWTKAQLNMNADLKDGRNILGAYDNTDPSGYLRYSAGFSGAPDDNLRIARISDKEKTDYFFSTLINPTYLDGAGVKTQFGKRVGDKKRSRINAGAWVGKQRTLFKTRLVTFQEDNFYFLEASNIINETVEIKIDNEIIDPRDYSIERTLGILTFKDESRVNPESRIEISFQYEPSVDDFTGDIASAEEMIVMNDNLAIGGTGIIRRKNEPDPPGTGEAQNILSAGSINSAIEYKSKDNSISFHAYPEVSGSYNDSILYAKQGNAGKISLDAVANKLKIKADGKVLSENYESVAEDNTVYGRLNHELSSEAIYDITPKMPVTLRGRVVDARLGNEKSGSLEYLYSPIGMPSIKLKTMSQFINNLSASTATDSMNTERLNGRVETEWDLPETICSRAYMKSIYINSSYDFDEIGEDSLSQHRNRRNHNLFLRLRVSPFTKLMLETKTIVRYTGKEDDDNNWIGLSRRLRPEFIIYSQELIPGITGYGKYRMDRSNYFPGDTTLRRNEDRVNGNILFIPGVWLPLLNPFQLNTGFSLASEDSSMIHPGAPIANSNRDTIFTDRVSKAFVLSPSAYFGQDVRLVVKGEWTTEDNFNRLAEKGFKINNDFDFYFRERKTNMLFEYDYNRDSTQDSLQGFVSSSRHLIQTKWTERWIPGLRSEFNIGASRQWSDTLSDDRTDAFFFNVLFDWRTSRFVREFRIQERLGPDFIRGHAFNLSDYDASLENKLDLSLKAGRNIYARLLLNLVYLFDEKLLKYDMAEFKFTLVF